MPATPARIAFIIKPYRIATANNSSVASTYGDLARETDANSPVETFFDNMADAAAIADQRLALLSVDRRRYTATLPDAIEFGAGLDYSQATPAATVIDEERASNHAALVSSLSLNLRDGSVSLELWG